ncbi:MAG: superoxide dismutase [Fidelibacterota bacterium]
MNSNANTFQLPPLPYEENALAPTISSQTVGLHYGKHHAAYFNNLNSLVQETEFAELSLEKVVQKSFGNKEYQKIFNNAGQAWNHIIYWEEMTPGGARQPSGTLAQKLEEHFGGFDPFKDKFVQIAGGVFGSGWAWLVESDGSLTIEGMSNAENPLAYGKKTLLGIDVWEHAYYLDYQNRRPDYVRAVLDNLINWDYVAERL